MPTQADFQRLEALREARKRGRLSTTQNAAVQELERRLQEGGVGQKIVEPAATMASSMIAEPVSGLAGIAGTLLPGEQGQGARWVEGVQNALTYQPKTQQGMQGLRGLGELMQPVGDAFQAAEQFSGDIGYDLGGPTLGAAMAAIPAAATEVTGVGKPARALKRLDDLPGFSEGRWAKMDVGPARIEVADAGDTAVVGSAMIRDPSQRGKGFGVAAYEELIERARNQGKKRIQSDETVEEGAANVYEALRRRGYDVRRHPDARKIETTEGDDFWMVDDDSPPFSIELGDTATQAASAKDLMRRWQDKGIKSFVRERPQSLVLDKIIVPEDARGSGLGSQAMQELIDYSEATGKRIELSPTSDFGGSKSRLRDFYKRFGFVENKGKAKDFEISEAMYRLPQSGQQ